MPKPRNRFGRRTGRAPPTCGAPTQLRDCASTGEVITDLDWIVVP